ncbi:hypothetical protein ACHAXT_007068 [Thalassiosira profunda]
MADSGDEPMAFGGANSGSVDSDHVMCTSPAINNPAGAPPPSHAVHDLLSLGEVESALCAAAAAPASSVNGLAVRLPLLLRWLSVAQPLATAPSMERSGDGTVKPGRAPDPNAIVPLLEDVAAAHPDAETIEALVSTVAPSVCREAMRNLPPLSRTNRGSKGSVSCNPVWGTAWNTSSLDTALHRLARPGFVEVGARKRPPEQLNDPGAKRQKTGEAAPMLEQPKKDGVEDAEMTEGGAKEAPVVSPIFGESPPAANDDSTEVRRVLRDLLALVKASLRTDCKAVGMSSARMVGGTVDDARPASSAEQSGSYLRETGFASPSLTLKSDSPLAETDEGHSSIGGRPSLAAVVAVLMQNAPLLRHEHVANALCRAAAPQAPTLIHVMAANAPAATQSLLRGCVSAYQLAMKYEAASRKGEDEADENPTNLSEARDILRIAVASTTKLATLSRREALNVIRILKEQKVMDGLVLSLLMEHEAIGAASFLVEGLDAAPSSISMSSSTATGSGVDGTIATRQNRKRALSLRQRMVGGTSPSIDGISSASASTALSRLLEELEKDKTSSALHFAAHPAVRFLRHSPFRFVYLPSHHARRHQLRHWPDYLQMHRAHFAVGAASSPPPQPEKDGVEDAEMTKENAEEAPVVSPIFGESPPAANDDFTEVRRVLRDLLALVKASLRTDCKAVGMSSARMVEGVTDDAGPSSSSEQSSSFLTETGFASPGLALKSDSPLAETDEGHSSIGGRPSLAAVVAVLMQNAPLLRHEHVANALCRAAAPQAPTVIHAMAANAPAATQGLLRGCITAYRLAVKYEARKADENPTNLSEAKDIVCTAVASTTKLATLSRREAINVIRILKEQKVMDGLVLSLLMEHEPIGAASFVVEGLSSKSMSSAMESGGGVDGAIATRQNQKRALSLRQRMVGGTSPSIDGISSASASTAPSRLLKELEQDKSLAERARQFIMHQMLKAKQNDKTISLGEAALFVQAHALLVHSIGIGAGSSAGSGSKLVEDTMTAIGKLFGSEDTCQDLPARAPKDNIYKTAICTVIVTCCKYPPIGELEGSVIGGQVVKVCLSCFQELLLCPPSLQSAIFASRLAGFIINSEAESLLEVTLEAINCSDLRKKEDASQMANACRWLSNSIESKILEQMHARGLELNSLVQDPLAVIEEMRRSDSPKANELDALVRGILSDASVCAKIIWHPLASDLIQESVALLVRRPAPHIPAILPLSLERLAQSLPWDTIRSDEKLVGTLVQFLLQLVYALSFLDNQPSSPFVISPRSFPLRECLAVLGDNGVVESGAKQVKMALEMLISTHCPDILTAVNDQSHLTLELVELVGSQSHAMKPALVCEAIQDCLNGKGDRSGLRAERVYLLCRSTYPILEVDVAGVGGLLASKQSQPKFYSYAALCRDPLLLLKSRKSVWSRRGLRSIMLRILQVLMNANECIARQSSLTESAALEYLTARDTIIVRCLVSACASGFAFKGSGAGASTPAKHCSMSVSMIRSIVSERRGVVATLIKQLPDDCVDWIVEFVPESLSDAQLITSLLSEPGLLTATERLATASAGLRIAIAHSSRGEADAKKLVSTCTATSLDSFTLVAGPIGVPVSVLREESGQEVTSLCREMMFRMITAMSTIDPTNVDLRNEACVTLSKIAALCKSEAKSENVKRKALLKEIWNACVQANTALGGAGRM